MKIRLMKCEICQRDTIQARTSITDGYNFGGNVMKPVWYCPICGTYWEKEIKSKLVAVKPR